MAEPLTTLGRILQTEEERDAIHIAVAPMIAGEKLRPGEHVGVVDGKAAVTDAPVGIVDPYLTVPSVRAGERFWLFLYPNTVTGLRHQWMHPAFGGPQPPLTISRDEHIAKSRSWLDAHAATLGLTAEAVMRDAERFLETEDYTVQRDYETWRNNFDATNFWHHYEVITGKVVPDDKKHSFYCCSC